MLTNDDLKTFAELLVRWAESEISAGKTLAHGDDNHKRDRHANRNRDRRVRGQENPQHDESDD
jgi:hypothetical protein